ncbi:MAG TPA: hypothetical protein PLN05_10405 [Pyrinomonadaceae bacterium]|nr:hypothetical protein [Chloracidobacterium sp.]HRJ87208.1 hypothetical protein [Pyrinomonadaceae bacterium]HRK50828.1 hypothetical protein [Pyrinomonadaceae bacterium]
MIFAADTRYQGGEWRDIRLREVPNGGLIKQCAVASPMVFPVAVSPVSRADPGSSKVALSPLSPNSQKAHKTVDKTIVATMCRL